MSPPQQFSEASDESDSGHKIRDSTPTTSKTLRYHEKRVCDKCHYSANRFHNSFTHFKVQAPLSQLPELPDEDSSGHKVLSDVNTSALSTPEVVTVTIISWLSQPNHCYIFQKSFTIINPVQALECPACSSTFTRPDNLKKHITKSHKAEANKLISNVKGCVFLDRVTVVYFF